MKKIRFYTIEDIDQLIDFAIAQNNEMSKKQNPINDHYREKSKTFYLSGIEHGNYICAVVEINKEIVSLGGICIYQTPPSFDFNLNEVGFLTNFYILPNFRNQGLAKEVLRKLIEYSKERKLMRLHMGATEMAHQLYTSVGFSEPKFKQFVMHL